MLRNAPVVLDERPGGNHGDVAHRITHEDAAPAGAASNEILQWAAASKCTAPSTELDAALPIAVALVVGAAAAEFTAEADVVLAVRIRDVVHELIG